jgi:L-threonylcarbamoyladenylate synthase
LKPLYAGDIKKLSEKFKDKKICLITFGNQEYNTGTLTFSLSKSSDLKEAALNLFSMIRQADESDAEVIFCEKLPDKGLGRAINDRLLRASIRP